MGETFFFSGFHRNDGKALSKEKPIAVLFPKGEAVYPMQQHIGLPAKPVVEVGDRVLVGQRIGEANGLERPERQCAFAAVRQGFDGHTAFEMYLLFKVVRGHALRFQQGAHIQPCMLVIIHYKNVKHRFSPHFHFTMIVFKKPKKSAASKRFCSTHDCYTQSAG